VCFYSATFGVVTDDFPFMRSEQSTAVSNVTCGYVVKRETWWKQWL